jgi:RNA polymerase sigma-70 factor, ECF subfamily
VGILAAAERSAGAADDALVERAARGDVRAFDALVVGRLDRCYRLAWSILANDADAADATQEAFVTAWRQLPRLRDAAAFDGWLNRIVANAALMARRHRRRLREVRVAPAVAGADASEPWDRLYETGRPSDIDAVAEGDAIGRAFGRLRPEDRAILALHHVDERPVAEIARTLGIPVGTAKWRLHAARKALERAMEAEA